MIVNPKKLPAIVVSALAATMLAVGFPVNASAETPPTETVTSTETPAPLPPHYSEPSLADDLTTLEGWHIAAKNEWPAFQVHTIRLWDTNTTWEQLNPAPNVYNWDNLDARIAEAQQHGVSDIVLVIWGTPAWATDIANPESAHWLAPSISSPPRNLDDWSRFVTKLTQRYKGIITGYEIGNEPETKTFWHGTPKQLADMTLVASDIIKVNDPNATVIAPAPIIRGTRIPDFTKEYWKEVAKSKARIDAISFHYYQKADPVTGINPDKITDSIIAVREAAAESGIRNKPVWVTEVNYQNVDPATVNIMDIQYRTLKKASENNVPRLYWYIYNGDGDNGFLLGHK